MSLGVRPLRMNSPAVLQRSRNSQCQPAVTVSQFWHSSILLGNVSSMASSTSITSASWLQSMKSMFMLVLALKSPTRSTPPKLMASPTSWHMCSNRLLSAYGEPCGTAYTMHRNEGLWKTLSKRSQILVPSLAIFQIAIIFAHVSLTSTAMPPLCFWTTPCVVTGLATSKQ